MKPFVTVEEASRVLGVKKSWIYAKIHAGTLPFPYAKIGHYVRIPEEGLRAYVDRATVLPN